MMRKSVSATNAALFAVGAIVVLPAAIVIVERLSSPCVSSFDRAERAMIAWAAVMAAAALLAIGGIAKGTWRQIAGSVLLQVGIVAAAAITLANLDFGSLDRSRQKRTIADMHTILQEMDALRARRGTYPVVRSVAELQRLTNRKLPHQDAWGNAFFLLSSADRYTVTSFGLCGEDDRIVPVDRSAPHADLIAVNGRFVRAPEWYEPHAVK